MSFGALSATAKEALGRAATAVGTSTTTGDGGMTPEERKASALLVYQVLPSRYGFDPADLRQADAVEIVVGQGAKPGGGGMLLGQKVNARVAAMRTLPPGIDQRSASRHPDWVGPDDLRIKIEELREATDWSIPIYVKVGATRVDHDVKLAVAAGADVVVVDGMQGGTAATQDVFIEHAGIPTLPAVRMAAEALDEIGMKGEVQLIVSGGIRSGADVAKALALGADAVSIGVAALLALGCNRSALPDAPGELINVEADYAALGTSPGHCAHCHTGRCPVGITTQDPVLEARLDGRPGGRVGGELPAGHDHGGHCPGPSLRKIRRPPSRTRGSGRPDRGSGGHGQGAAGRHRAGSPAGPARERIGASGRIGRGRDHRRRGQRTEHGPGPGRAGRAATSSSWTGPPSAREGAASRAASSAATTASAPWPPWPGTPCRSSRTPRRSWGRTRATATPGYLVGVGPENLGALRANVAMHQSLGIEVDLVGHDTAQEMWPCGRT